MDPQDTTAASDAAASSIGEQPLQVQSLPAVPSESYVHGPAAIDAALAASLSSQGNNLLLQTHNDIFAVVDGALNGNGALPLGMMLPTHPSLQELGVPHTLQSANGHAMSAGMANLHLSS